MRTKHMTDALQLKKKLIYADRCIICTPVLSRGAFTEVNKWYCPRKFCLRQKLARNTFFRDNARNRSLRPSPGALALTFIHYSVHQVNMQ